MKFEEWFEEQFPGVMQDARELVKRSREASDAEVAYKEAKERLRVSRIASESLRAARYAWNARGQS